MEDTFDILFRQYYAPMVLYADGRLNNREQAEDVVQDVFSKLLETGASFEDTQKARGYLFTVLKNKIIDIFRYNKLHKTDELTESLIQDTSEEQIFEIELYEQLYQEVEALPVKISEAMRLRMQGYDNHEIAEMLDTNYHTVRSRIHKGIILLREKFDRNLLYSIFL